MPREHLNHDESLFTFHSTMMVPLFTTGISVLLIVVASASDIAVVSESTTETGDTILDLHSRFFSADALQHIKRHLRGHGGGHAGYGMMGEHGYGGYGMMGHHGGGDMMGHHHDMMMDGCEQGDESVRCGMGLTREEHEVVMALFDHRLQISRTPKEIANGFNITTTSSNAHTAELIQRHVYAMTHLGKKRRIRQCDPLYRALFDHMDDTEMQVDYLENSGVQVVHTGTTDCAKQLVKDHTYTVSQFVDTGKMWPNHNWKLPQQCTAAAAPQEEENKIQEQEERVEERIEKHD